MVKLCTDQSRILAQKNLFEATVGIGDKIEKQKQLT